MEERKVPQEELGGETEREEYSFLQEVIKDEEGGRKRLKRGIFKATVYGAFLGIAASVSFCLFRPWLEPHFNDNPSKVEFPEDEEEKEGDGDAGGEADDGKKEEKKELDEDSYRRVLQNLNTEAARTKRCIVSVSSIADIAGQEKADSSAGILIADNGIELLVFSKIIDTKEGENIWITFSDGKHHMAAEKMRDYNLGFCVYAVARNEIEKDTWSGIELAQMGNSNLVENGEAVIILGRPFGADESVSYGVATAEEEYVDLADGRYRLISTNVAGAKQGSGAIFNRWGSLIGIISPTSIVEGNNGRISGYGISDIKDIVERLSNGTPVPYTGICGMDVTEELTEKGMPQGVYVKEIKPDSPAMAAGLQSGDVIIGIDGQNIVSLSNYHSILMQKSEGTLIKLQGCRQGAGDEYVEIEFSVTIGSRNNK
ncbi:MAG: serine protease [Dorea sp.]|nr:serine protease [Dorea sp.]MCI9248797.1 serine protease [Dorea sp.]